MTDQVKKYVFVPGDTKHHCGIELKRIRRLSDGMLGGYIQHEGNLSHAGGCWVDQHACVLERAVISEDAFVSDHALVRGDATVSGSAKLMGHVIVQGYAKVSGRAMLFDSALVQGRTEVCGRALLFGCVAVQGWACVKGDVRLYGDVRLGGDAFLESSDDVVWASNVGSEGGTLVAFRTKDGSVGLSRGCFIGSVEQFLAQSAELHSEVLRKEYAGLVEWMILRLNRVKIENES